MTGLEPRASLTCATICSSVIDFSVFVIVHFSSIISLFLLTLKWSFCLQILGRIETRFVPMLSLQSILCNFLKCSGLKYTLSKCHEFKPPSIMLGSFYLCMTRYDSK